MFKKIKKFTSLSFIGKLRFLEAFIFLHLSKLAVKTVPLKKMAPYLGRLNAPFRTKLTVQETEKAEAVKLYIHMAGGNVSWDTVCLDRALAGMLMLKRRKIPCALCFGAKKNEPEKKMDAHAWIVCGEKILLGGVRSHGYTKVAEYVNMPSGK